MLFFVFSAFVISNVSGATGCDFVVDFASHCCGPDRTQISGLRSYLEANESLVSYEEGNWGKEGEATFCVHVKSHADLLAVKGHLGGIVGRSSGDESRPSGVVVSCRETKNGAPPSRRCTDPYPKPNPKRVKK